ncbi:MAG: ribonuclease T, partial [Halieaceae bacterium]
MPDNDTSLMRDRFRGFLPVVVDIETGGFNCQTDAILEMAITELAMNEQGELVIEA